MLHQACFCAICSVVSVPDWCNVSMGPKANACTSKRGALAVFKSVLHVLDRSLDQPGTAMQTRPRPGAQACTVSTRSGAVCVRGFVFVGVCCLFQIGAGLSSVNMPPWVIACSSIRGASTVFKSGLHVLDATLDLPGTAMQTCLRLGAQGCTVSTRIETGAEEVCWPRSRDIEQSPRTEEGDVFLIFFIKSFLSSYCSWDVVVYVYSVPLSSDSATNHFFLPRRRPC